MDSCWSHQHPAYRCRHSHTPATASSSNRPRNAYVREDRILPHPPALAIRLGLAPNQPAPTPPVPRPPAIVTRLRTAKITLAYDPKGMTLTASTPTTERIFIG
ncbi:hypothetical protein [Streptomyces sp. S186]|uniref:hypothetical protein n=1 Tax=Streptomyces sp. S186 TaxID=3434395 RepID=UPI003F6762CC